MTKHFAYTKTGRYVAVCNKTNWCGHYVKVFQFPDPLDQLATVRGDAVLRTDMFGVVVDMNPMTASWYFLNRVDFVACLEAVYPIEMFDKLDPTVCKCCGGEKPADQSCGCFDNHCE